jgi:hypothetical protein
MTQTVKRYLGCDTEPVDGEDIEMTDVPSDELPAIPRSRAPFNSKQWHIDLTGTGYSSNSFAAADRSVESILNPARAAKLAKAGLGPNIRDVGGLALESLSISLKDDTITLSGRVSLGNRKTTRPLNGQELEALRPEVESYLNGLDTSSHEFNSLRYDQENVPHTVETALLEIGKAYIQEAKFDCNHFRNRSLTDNSRIDLSAPLILNGTGTEGVYDRAIFMAERQIESLSANEFAAETNPTKKQAFTTVRDATIDQLQAERPSRVSDEQWSIFSNEVMNHLLSEVDIYAFEEPGLGEAYSLAPKISTWDCSAAGDRPYAPDDPDWPNDKAKRNSPDDATHIHATLIRTNKDASDTTTFADSYHGEGVRNLDFFDIPKSVASTE